MVATPLLYLEKTKVNYGNKSVVMFLNQAMVGQKHDSFCSLKSH